MMEPRSSEADTQPPSSGDRMHGLRTPPKGYGTLADKFPLEYTRATVGEEPYKGTDSYQFEDSPLFSDVCVKSAKWHRCS
ncbi:hypothetical protein ACERZ8_12630 [Tateyamaria armeniaca]|uniref:Uncharacterized protein n=1 Tax=Tateyamaria armeniaca TaxID=2518930 RepID=A0ABW8UUB0_9RHOB